MNATARTARQIIAARRAAAKAHKAGQHTLKSHCLKAGLTDEIAGSVAGALRGKAKSTGVTGCPSRVVRMTEAGTRPVRGARRFTATEFLILAHAYKPRAAKYVAARAQLLAV